jgi:hypothetical protein
MTMKKYLRVLLVIHSTTNGYIIIIMSHLTFKDLEKRVSLEATTEQQFRLTKRLQDKPFWIWNVREHKLKDIKTNRLL